MISAIDRNFLLHATMIPSHTSGMSVTHENGFSYVDSGLSCDTFNILHIHDAANLEPEKLASVIAFYRKASKEFCVWINQQQLSDELIHQFNSQGLIKTNEETGMVLDLTNYEGHNDSTGEVVTVSSKIMLQEYARVLAANWTPPDQNVIQYYENTADHYLSSDISLLVASYRGIPCTTAELFPTDHETAGVYGLATLESFRGKGLGFQMMQHVINLSIKRGFKHLILQATGEGIGIYRKLGFQPQVDYFEFG